MATSPSRRTLQAGDAIQKELTHLIRRELRDPRLSEQHKLLLVITQVKVSRDFSVADVYISWTSTNQSDDSAHSFDTLIDILTGAAGFLRSKLARTSTMRTIPELRFRHDETSEQSNRIATLLANNLPKASSAKDI